MHPNLKIIFGLFGGLAIFIYGMNMMSDNLQKACGSRMKKIISCVTGNPILGMAAGLVATAVLQSSSATTVMAISFVSAGLMSLPQAISVIFGANIGTTITAQIIAFKISNYIYLFVFAGFAISFFSSTSTPIEKIKSEKWKYIGQAIFAFGILFLGIETMGSVMKPLASSPIFTNLIERVSSVPVLGVLLGTVMTLVVQSSSATIAVLQNFAAQDIGDGATSVISLAGAIPILLGDNIGTTITALLASIGQSRNAKRTALAHTIFNVSGALVFIWLVSPFAKLIQFISPKGAEVEVVARQIANAHTVFNIAMTVVWLPLIPLMVKIVKRLVKNETPLESLPKKSDTTFENQNDKKQNVFPVNLQVALDERLLKLPYSALLIITNEVEVCKQMAASLVGELEKAFGAGSYADDKIKTDIKKNILSVLEFVQKIKNYTTAIFLSGFLTEAEGEQTEDLVIELHRIEKNLNRGLRFFDDTQKFDREKLLAKLGRKFARR